MARRKYRSPAGGRDGFIHRRFILASRGCASFNPIGASMMTIASRTAAAAAFASLLLMSSAYAQTTPPAAAPAATEKKAEKPRTAASLECSKEADAKGLHGKERKKFRSDCKKGAAPKAK